MSSCSVKNCKNYKSKGKDDGISYHRIPRNSVIRAKWVKLISQSHDTLWKPGTNSVVCSEHFRKNDFSVAKTGRKNLSKNALPIKKLNKDSTVSSDDDNDCDVIDDECDDGVTIEVLSRQPVSYKSKVENSFKREHLEKEFGKKYLEFDTAEYRTSSNSIDNEVSEMSLMNKREKIEFIPPGEVCLVCLATGCKMYYLVEGSLRQTFIHLVNVQISSEVGVVVCWQCAGRLHGATKLRRKARKAHALLVSISREPNEINESLKSVDRHQHGLIWYLTTNQTEATNYNPLKIEQDIKQENTNSANCDNYCDDASMENDSHDVPLSDLEVGKIKTGKQNSSCKKYKQNGRIENEAHSKVEDSARIKKEKLQLVKNGDEHKENLKVVVDNSSVGFNRGRKIGPYAAERKMKIDKMLAVGFTIKELSPKEQLEEFEKRKLKSSYRARPFKCTSCYQGFSDQFKYDMHMQRHQKEYGSHECSICKLREKHASRLNEHMKHHSQQYTCKQCGMLTNRCQVAIQHLKIHSGATFKCVLCSEKFTHHSTYLSHKRTKHVNEHVCEQCGYTFLSEKGIYVHKHRTHGKKKPILEGPNCAECKVKFMSQEAYDRHLGLSSKHSSNTIMAELRKKTELTKKPISCEVCGVVVLGRSKYAWHFRQQHPEKQRTKARNSPNELLCYICGKVFTHHSYLRDHIMFHFDKKSFQCGQCKKCFKASICLKIHERTHSPDYKHHKCEECGKTFSHLHNLRRHTNVHSRRKTYKCDYCEKIFYWIGGLKSHMNHIHLKIPWPTRKRQTRREKFE